MRVLRSDLLVKMYTLIEFYSRDTGYVLSNFLLLLSSILDLCTFKECLQKPFLDIG